MTTNKRYCPCCGHEMFEFTICEGLVYICSYAPCKTKYFANNSKWYIADKDIPTARQRKQIRFINRQLYSKFYAISKLQANQIIDNYYKLAQMVKRGDNNGQSRKVIHQKRRRA